MKHLKYLVMAAVILLLAACGQQPDPAQLENELETASAASIWTGKEDYAPAEIVDIFGAGWQPGESIELFVDDDGGKTWTHGATVTAGDDGAFLYEFRLPTWYVPSYTVTATGEHTGVVETTFLDDIVRGDSSTNVNGSGDMASSELTINAPAVSIGDVLIAQVTTGIETTEVICAPIGWTSILRTNNYSVVTQEIFYHVASSNQAQTSHKWQFRTSSGSCGTDNNKVTGKGAAGGIIRYSGIDTMHESGPIVSSRGRPCVICDDGVGRTATAPSTFATANDLVIRFFGMNRGGDSGTSNERFFDTANRIYNVGLELPSERTAAASDATQGAATTTGEASATILKPDGSSDRAYWVAQTVVLSRLSTAVTTYPLSVTKVGTGSGTITSSPTGIDCGDDCSANFDDGTEVTLTATAATGSTFTGWSGAGTDGAGGTRVVSMSEARNVTATFDLVPITTYPLSITKDGAGSGTVESTPAGINCGDDCSANFDDGTEVTLMATAGHNSTFNGWSGDGTGDTTRLVTMDSAKAVTAIFKANQAITFTSTAPSAVYGGEYSPAARATSELSVTFGASGSCAYDSGTGKVTMTGVGECTVTADQAGDDDYNAAPQATQVFSVNRAVGSVNISNIPSTATFGGNFTPTYTTNSDGMTSTASLTTNICSVSSGVVSFAAVGTCTLQPSVAEGTNHLAATGAEQSFSIGAASTTTTVSVSPPSQQYSDLVTLSASVSSLVAGTQVGTVQFKINGSNVGSPQALSSGSATLSNYQVTQAPGTLPVTAEFTSTNANFAGSTSTAQTLTVTQENARATYTGLPFVTTSSATATSASVALSATIQDISAVDSSDASAGDIRNARVSFVNRDTNAVLCSNLTPSLVSSSDTKTGTVGCNASLSVGSSSSTSYTIGIVVEGYYIRNDSSENTVVTVAQPINGMITGGGHLITSSSAGQYAGGNGLKTNLGFNVKYNKSMTSLQGNVNIIVRASDGKVYQIKANSMTSLLTNVTAGTGNFVSKANLTDVTNSLSPVPLGGNYTLQMTMKDNGNPGNTDTIGITLRDSGGALLFSSNWSGTNTWEQTLNGGNLVVR